jgi:hypothetical protein
LLLLLLFIVCRDLRTNLPRELMGFSDLPIPWHIGLLLLLLFIVCRDLRTSLPRELMVFSDLPIPST